MSIKYDKFFSRIKQKGHLILFGHVLNPLWKSRIERRKIRDRVTKESTMVYLQRYASKIKDFTPKTLDESQEPERVFTIWFQGEEQAPALVKACFRSMRRHLKQELIVLDEKNIFDWITLPDYIVRKWEEGKIHNTQFSDLCRIELLYRYGGIWADATDYFTSPIPKEIMDQDFFLFMAGEKIQFSYSYIQSCFIRCRKGNPLMAVWREANYIYWKEEDKRIDYFNLHLLFRLSIQANEIAAENFKKMLKIDQDPTHVMWFDHYNEKYDPEKFEKLVSGSFFQKTTYKADGIDSLPKESIGAYVINS